MRRFVKRLVYSMAILVVLPLWLLYLLQSAVLGRVRSFGGYSQLLSLFPGLVGDYLRWAFYKLTLAQLGEDTFIGFGVTLADPGIRIGSGVYVGAYCNLGLCSIEDDVLLGTGVHVMSGFAQHGYADLAIPIRRQRGELLNVRIGCDAWIGNKAVVGNHVGKKCIIGAASVVVHEILPYSVAVGNPAKVVRDRRQEFAP
jgi:virginiamycin A acetyltransferase